MRCVVEVVPIPAFVGFWTAVVCLGRLNICDEYEEKMVHEVEPAGLA